MLVSFPPYRPVPPRSNSLLPMKTAIIFSRQVGILRDITGIISIDNYYFAIIIPANIYFSGYLRCTRKPISGYQGITPDFPI